MIHMSELFDMTLYADMLDQKYLTVRAHPTRPLSIIGYSNSAQYDRCWNEVTAQCRGLIVDDNGYVMGRPYNKFWNWSEHEGPIPSASPPILYPKADGSLLIMMDDGEVATRGSFESNQAKWARNWFAEREPVKFPAGITTLGEVIFAENRIVLDYHGWEGVILLGAVGNDTGRDILPEDCDWWPFDRIQREEFDLNSALAKMDDPYDNLEGWVAVWPSSDGQAFRLKIKVNEYVALHRTVTGLSTRTVHEALATNTFDELIEAVPDEFHPWVRQVSGDLTDEFNGILIGVEFALAAARHAAGPFYDRRELAEEIKKTAYPGLCFALEDGKEIGPRIWTMIRPERSIAMIIEDA